MKGTYGSDAMHLDMTTNGQGGPGSPGQSMSLVMTIDGKQAGTCTGTEGKS